MAEQVSFSAMPRLSKRWRWVGCFSDELMLCAAVARIGPGRVSWWAVWDRAERTLAERTTYGRSPVRFAGEDGVSVRDGTVEVDLRLDLEAVDAWRVTSTHAGRPIHTVKRAGVPVSGRVRLLEREFRVQALGVVDDSWGLHARHTAWRWSAGVGLAGTTPVAWNLVEGLHDAPAGSERALWVDGRAHELASQPFAADLSSVGGLEFTREASRTRRERLGIVASDYEAPFGTFSGELDGLRIAGLGVMESHVARW